MGKGHWLVLALAVLGGLNAGIVWLIQFSGYSLWPDVGQAEFAAYLGYWHRSMLWLVAIPYAASTAGAILLLRVAPPQLARSAAWAVAVLQGAIDLVQWTWLAPLEGRGGPAAGGRNAAAYRQLLQANWFRIALVTSCAALLFWMMARLLWPVSAMSRSRRLLFLTSALSLYGVGNVWLVQLVCYRLWPFLGRQEAFAYHNAWWRSIWGVIFIPAGAVLLGSLAMLWARPEGVSRGSVRAGFSLQLVTYVLTAVWWGPLMARLISPDGALNEPLYHLLMTTHWLRVALITAYGAFCIRMLAQSRAGGTWNDAHSPGRLTGRSPS